MASQLEEAQKTGAIDVSSSPGQKPGKGFAIIVRPSASASQADIKRAIQTGVFKFSDFDVQPTRVSTVGTFDPKVERQKALAAQKLAPATVRGLVATGTVSRQEASDIVRKQKVAEQVRERRVAPSPGKIKAQEVAKKKVEEEKVKQFFQARGGPFAPGFDPQAFKVAQRQQALTTLTADVSIAPNVLIDLQQIEQVEARKKPKVTKDVQDFLGIQDIKIDTKPLPIKAAGEAVGDTVFDLIKKGVELPVGLTEQFGKSLSPEGKKVISRFLRSQPGATGKVLRLTEDIIKQIPKEDRPKAQQAVVLATAGFGATAAPFLVGGPVGGLLRGAAIVSSPKPAETALAFGAGAAFGLGAKATRFLGPAKQALGPGLSQAISTSEQVAKTGLALIGPIFALEAGRQITQAAVQGEPQTKAASAQLVSDFAAFQAGAGASKFIVGRLTNPTAIFLAKQSLVKKFGVDSPEVKAFDTAFALKKGRPATKAFTAKDVQSIAKEPLAIKATNKIIRQNAKEFEVIFGTTDIPPQTRLRAPPRGPGSAGDIDAAARSPAAAKKVAVELRNELLKAGFSPKEVVLTAPTPSPIEKLLGIVPQGKFSVNFRGKQLLNIASSGKRTFTELEEITGVFETPPGIFKETAKIRDPFGIPLLDLSFQARRKAFSGRAKDLTDILGIATVMRSFASKKPRPPVLETGIPVKPLGSPLERALGVKPLQISSKPQGPVSPIGIPTRRTPKLISEDSSKLLKIVGTPLVVFPPSQKGRITKSPLGKITDSGVTVSPSAQKLFAPSPPFTPSPSPVPLITTSPPISPTISPPFVPTVSPPFPPTISPPGAPTVSPPPIITTSPPITPTLSPPFVTISPPGVPTTTPPFITTLTPPIKPPGVPLLFDPPFIDLIPGVDQQGFNVLGKSRGKFSKLNKKGPLTRANALALGGDLIDGSASAQFKLREAKGKPVKPEFTSSPFSFRAAKFRNPIRKGKKIADPNTFIEKTAFRIDSPGELKQITAEGLLAIRRKKSKQNFFAF